MTIQERAATLSHDEIVTLLLDQQRSSESLATLTASNGQLAERVSELQRQVDWFKRQLFGSRSDRRLLPEHTRQLTLGESWPVDDSVPVPQTTVRAHVRTRHAAASTDEEPLRFDPSVPVQLIDVPNPEIEGHEEDYRLVGEKITDRLAQRPGSYVVLRFRRQVYKEKYTGAFSCPPVPPAVIEKSFADASFLAGLLIDKFRYHLPLYRQHQRLADSGIHLGRSTLTSLVQRTAELLAPIYQSQLASVLQSKTLTMDETPIRAGRKSKGKMKRGYFWPVYGDRDEIVFPFSPSRGSELVEKLLDGYEGVLVTDGYQVYEEYAQRVNGLVHAQCWAHMRRNFVEAEAVEPEHVPPLLDRIAELYRHEDEIRKRQLTDERKLLFRATHCKPVVDTIFEDLQQASEDHLLLPTSPYTKAVNYALDREEELRVFLEYPDVPMDTNHLEREIRPIALGRKNWLFAWTELGAHDVGLIQSLLGTCRLQGVDPYTYFVDVLQRIATHPISEVAQLTPRLWKEQFARNPMRSNLDRIPRGRDPAG